MLLSREWEGRSRSSTNFGFAFAFGVAFLIVVFIAFGILVGAAWRFTTRVVVSREDDHRLDASMRIEDTLLTG